MSKNLYTYKGPSPWLKHYSKRELDKKIAEEAKKAVEGGTTEVIIGVLACCMQVLHDDFGFGDVRMNRFKDKVQDQFDLVSEDYVDWSDFRGNFKMVEK